MNDTPDANTPIIPPVTPEIPQEPVKAPALPYEFKASFKEYSKRINKGAIIAAIVLSSFFFIKFGALVGVLSVAGRIVLIGLILFLLTHRSITLKPEGIDYRNGLGKVRTIHYQDIEGVKVFLNYVEPSFGAFPRILIGVRDGAPLSVLAVYWPLDELEKLLAVLRDKTTEAEYYDQPVAYGTIAKQFPTYVPYIERHPGRVAAITTVAILVLAAAIAVAVVLLG